MWDESALLGLEWVHSDNVEVGLPCGTIAEMRLSPRREMGVPRQML
jgi:hypothetical protein